MKSINKGRKETSADLQKEVTQNTQKKITQEKIAKLIREKSLIINAILIILAIALGYGWYSTTNETETFTGIGEKKAEKRVMELVSDNMVQPGTEVSVKGITIEKGMYKAILDIGGNETVTYLSMDGEMFFPNPVVIADIEQKKAEAQRAADQAANIEPPKTEKPKVEAFIMSYCPFGTQMQKGLLPVVEALGSAIDFKFKFVDYAMHGEKEIEENVRQHCIEEKEPKKFSEYLSCFLRSKSMDSASCLRSANINSSILVKCANAVNERFKIEEKLKDKSAWKGNYPPFDVYKEENEAYSVQGSPTLVINGTTIQPKRDSASLLAAICKGFKEKPAACGKKLSEIVPSPGFGEGEGADSSGSCN
ncbi:MAG: hypothetical protein U9M90_01440 [Patescibacteria group bacterium]|nr:hypothetical protein [Patescibacteria group bacterium]